NSTARRPRAKRCGSIRCTASFVGGSAWREGRDDHPATRGVRDTSDVWPVVFQPLDRSVAAIADGAGGGKKRRARLLRAHLLAAGHGVVSDLSALELRLHAGGGGDRRAPGRRGSLGAPRAQAVQARALNEDQRLQPGATTTAP